MELTYFQSLAIFLGPPLLLLTLFVLRDLWLFKTQGNVTWTPYIIVIAHVIAALVYTTPWDNYLVASGVWWYSTDQVTGITIGYVPIEEYIFFITQTLVTGLWTLFVIRHMVQLAPVIQPHPKLRIRGTIVISFIGIFSLIAWLYGWESLNYLSLIISWASLPFLIQFAFGADILWANRYLIGWAILPPTIYL